MKGELATFDPEHVGCCIVPDFVDKPNGFYTRRIVLDSDFKVGSVNEGTDPDCVEYHLEVIGVPIPRYTRQLIWRQV